MQTVFTDQMGREVSIGCPPRRIVSLVPSQTELLYDLGLDTEIVGITKFCIHPHHWFRNKVRVGGTKNFSIEKIMQLQPDLVIGNKEENTREGIEILEKNVPLWMSDVNNLSDALFMIQTVGKITHKTHEAARLAEKIQMGVVALPKPSGTLRVLYLIWQTPLMAAGHQTFINDMLTNVCGFTNALPPSLTRYPELTASFLQTCQPDVVFLSSEPYPFKQNHVSAIQELVPNSLVVLVNGEMFSWYGSRLLQSVTYFQQLIADMNALAH